VKPQRQTFYKPVLLVWREVEIKAFDGIREIERESVC
jgi:hypothetical protein